MSIKAKAPDLGILESRAALGVRRIFGRNSDIGNLRGGKIEAKPAARALAIERGVAPRPDALAGVEGELSVEGVERAAANDAEFDGRPVWNIGEMRENAARRLLEVGAVVGGLGL